MIQDRITERKYDRIAKEYYFSVGALQGFAKMPSPEEMEIMRQRSTMILKNPEQHFTSYKYLNT